MLNSHSPFSRGYKSPATRGTVNDLEKKMKDCWDYVKGITLLNRKPLDKCRRKMFVIRFEMAASSFIAVSRSLLQLPGVNYVLAYKLSLKHYFLKSDRRKVSITTQMLHSLPVSIEESVGET